MLVSFVTTTADRPNDICSVAPEGTVTNGTNILAVTWLVRGIPRRIILNTPRKNPKPSSGFLSQAPSGAQTIASWNGAISSGDSPTREIASDATRAAGSEESPK